MRYLFLAAAALAAPFVAPAAATAQSEADAILFHGAVRDGDLAEVRRFLDRGVPVNILNSGGYSPLMTAANGGHLEIARLLLDRGADKTIKNSSGWDALFLAKLNGHTAVAALLEGAGGAPAAAPTAPAPPARPAPSRPATPATPPAQPAQSVPAPAAGTVTTWPKLGAFKVGDEVLYSGTAGKTWQRGRIRSIDPVYGYNFEGVTGSTDPYFVTSIQRQPYWTSFFFGDWRISVPMATNLVTDGRYVYRTFSGGLRLPPLRINADGSYSWRVMENGGERLIQGRWLPNPDGPGVILQKGDRGADWLAYNNTRTGSSLGDTLILSSDKHTYQDGSRITGQ